MSQVHLNAIWNLYQALIFTTIYLSLSLLQSCVQNELKISIISCESKQIFILISSTSQTYKFLTKIENCLKISDFRKISVAKFLDLLNATRVFNGIELRRSRTDDSA